LRDASLSASRFEDFPEERAASRRRGSGLGAQPAPTPPRAPKKKPSVLARVFAPRRMGMLLLLGIGGLAFVGVPMNALFLQDGRHPAPLFAARAPAPQKSEPADAGAPAPTARKAQMETARPEADAARTDAAKPEALKTEIAPAAKPSRSDAAALKAMLAKPEAAAPAARPEKKREVAARDPIAVMLGGETPAKAKAPSQPRAPAQPPQAQTQAPKAQAPAEGVVAAQRALQRLGYVVKPDGVVSAGTRQAIEKFERDHGLPVKGELTPRIARLLAARAAAPHP
jgi:hypothetical protein